MSDDQQRKLQAGIDAARNGDRATARRLLEDVIRTDPDNELAWIWLASSVTAFSERRDALERVLEINPNNTRAREALGQLLGQPSAQPPGQRASPARSAARPAATPAEAQGRQNISLLAIAGVMLLGFGIVIAGLIAGELTSGEEPTRTPAFSVAFETQTAVAAVVIATPTPRAPVATNTLSFPTVSSEDAVITLPPSFTPTRTPEPTPTATFTPTPYPVEEYTLLAIGLPPDAAETTLFRANGDGSDQTALAEGIRDLAFDPSGEFIAFVRDVEYPRSEVTLPQPTPTRAPRVETTAEVTLGEATAQPEPTAEATVDQSQLTGTIFLPEIFIAPVDDLAAARQLTQMRATIVSSPTWSPEGRELVFVSNANSQEEELWYILADGTGIYRITDNNAVDREPAWSPVLGSRTIVFTSDLDNPTQPELYRIELSDPDTPVVYTALTSGSGSSYSPAWSPNGRQIVFISDRRGDPDVYVMPADGGTFTSVTGSDGDAEDMRPIFTPDSRLILFISNREDDLFQIYLTTPDGRELTRLTDDSINYSVIQLQPVLLLRLRG